MFCAIVAKRNCYSMTEIYKDKNNNIYYRIFVLGHETICTWIEKEKMWDVVCVDGYFTRNYMHDEYKNFLESEFIGTFENPWNHKPDYVLKNTKGAKTCT